jgi:FSR family fosmidomycin resistance protein-like MFS transporter
MTDTRKTILVLSSGHLVTDIYMSVIPAMIPLLILQNGYSYFMAGLLVTTYNLASSFTQPVLGWLSDSRGIALHMSYSLLISAVFIALMGYATNYALLLVFAAIAALGHAFFHPSALSLVSRLCSEGNRGSLTAIFVVGGNIGFSCGPVLTGAVLANFSLHGLALLVIPALILAPVLFSVLPPVARSENRLLQEQSPKITEKDSLKPFAVLIAASTFRAWSVFAAIAFLPTYLVQRGYEISTANLLVTIMLLAGVCGQMAGGWISDRYGRKEFTVGALALSLPSFYLFMVSTGVVALVFLIIFGFALWSTFSVALAMSHEMMPGKTGMASGMMLGFTMGMGGIGAAVNGIIADNVSLAAALGTIPIPVFISLVLFALIPYPWKMRRASPVRP